MTDLRIRNLADILVNYSTKVQQGDWVEIMAGYDALPLVKEVVACVLKAGGRPSTHFASNEIDEVYLKHASDEQLLWVPPTMLQSVKDANVLININAPENTRSLSGIDPARQQKRQQAFKDWVEVYMTRSAQRDLRWVITNYPCRALAQDADMSLGSYEDFIYKATFADQDDPIKSWQGIHDNQARLIQWLDGKKEVQIRGKHADILLSIDGRKFMNSDGDRNMPSGEIYTSPVEDSAQGWVEFTYPAIHGGREVEGVRLEFDKGKVVKASAAKNEDFLIKMLDLDEGSRFLGEIGIGTNYGIDRFTKSILYDEKIGGSFHLAVGGGFPEAGGRNKSSLHWDLICDAREETEMLVDGELFYKNGKFQV